MRLPDGQRMGSGQTKVRSASTALHSPTMDRTIVDSLLYRARMLSDYALNTDQLPEDSRIFEEIDALAQTKERDGNPATAPLVAEMRKVSRKANVTVEQLMH